MQRMLDINDADVRLLRTQIVISVSGSGCVPKFASKPAYIDSTRYNTVLITLHQEVDEAMRPTSKLAALY